MSDKEDIRAITIRGQLYWMPKAEANDLIEEFLEKLDKILLIENCDKAVEGTLLYEICKLKWELEERVSERYNGNDESFVRFTEANT